MLIFKNKGCDNMADIISCKNLRQCESIYEDQIDNVKLLGDIFLNKEEVELVGKLLKKSLSNINYNPSILKKEGPITTSLFLVWKGVYDYQEGNYWESIYNTLESSDNQINSILSETFYYTLEKYDLPIFDVGRTKNVSQFLIHGYIPNHYISEFLDDFLYPQFVEVFKKTFDKNFIRKKINYLKDDHDKHTSLKEEYEEANKKLKTRKVNKYLYKEIIANWDKLIELKELRSKFNGYREVGYLYDKPVNYLSIKEEELEEIHKTIQEKEREIKNFEEENTNIIKLREEYYQQKKLLDEKEFKLNELSNQINNLLSNLLKNNHGEYHLEKIQAINLPQLKDIINRYSVCVQNSGGKGLITYIQTIYKRLYRFFNSKKVEEEILDVLKNLPVHDFLIKEAKEDLYENINILQGFIKERAEIEKKIESNKKLVDNLLDIAAIKEDTLFSFDNHEIEEKINELRVDLDKLYENRDILKKDIAEYKMNLTLLSDGEGFEEGLLILKDQFKTRKRIKQIESELNLSKEYETTINLLLAEELTLEKAKNKLETIDKEAQELKEKLEFVEQNLNLFPETLYNLIESTRILIFQGEDIVVDFVYQCLMYIKSLCGKNNDFSNDLDPNISRLIKDWWESYYENEDSYEEVIVDNHIYKIRNIKVIYSIENREIFLLLPEMIVEIPDELKDNDLAVFKVYKDNNREAIEIQKLTLFKYNNFLRTGLCQLVLPGPGNYKCQFIFNGSIIREWLIEKKDYYFFNNREMINSSQLPADNNIGIVVADDYMLEPNEIIVQKDDLIDDWTGYSYYFLDLSDRNYLRISNNINEFTFKSKLSIEPHLLNGIAAENYRVDRNIVYKEKLPDLIIADSSEFKEEELRLWELTTELNGDMKIYRLDELSKDILTSHEFITIHLDKLLNNKIGFYNLKLKRNGRQSLVKEFSFVLLPQILINFDKTIYPLNGENEFGWIYIDIPEEYQLSIEETFSDIAHIIDIKDNHYRIRFNTVLTDIVINLRNIELDIIYPLKVNIPTILWSINTDIVESSKWLHDNIELWHGDIFGEIMAELLVKIDTKFISKIDLTLNSDQQIITSNKKDSIFKFNLLKLSDSIKSSDKNLHDLSLIIHTISNDKINCSLFSIRTKWEVKDIIINSKVHNQKRLLDIEWTNLGKPTASKIKIWNLRTKELQIEESLGRDQNSISVAKNIRELLPGPYRVELAEENTWFSESNTLPLGNKDNTEDFFLGNWDELIPLIENIKIYKVENDDGKTYSLKDPYYLSEIKLSPEFEGEERFQAKFMPLGNRKRCDNILDGVYSFYIQYESEYILPFVVSAEKDGLMYCTECCKLFLDASDDPHGTDIFHAFVPVKYYSKISFMK